jgi:hypothetical protein
MGPALPTHGEASFFRVVERLVVFIPTKSGEKWWSFFVREVAIEEDGSMIPD